MLKKTIDDINAINKLCFFRVVEGRDIFYPWGYAGEGFFLSGNQKKNLNILLKLLKFAFLFLFVSLIYLDAFSLPIISQELYVHLFFSFFLLSALLYFFVVCFFVKGKEHCGSDKYASRSGNKVFIGLSIFVLMIQVGGFVNVVRFHESVFENFSYLIVIYIVGISLSAFVVMRIIITRGHFFTHKDRLEKDIP
jgi:hypothetical protein